MRRFFPIFISGWGALALLLVRVVIGIAFILHGWPKIQNPTTWMNAMGQNVPPFLQAIAALVEFGGGIALVLGLLTPLVVLGIVCQMAAALFLVHFPMRHPFVPSAGGPSYELPLVYLVVAILLLVLGPGRWSLDAVLFGRRPVSKAH